MGVNYVPISISAFLSNVFVLPVFISGGQYSIRLLLYDVAAAVAINSLSILCFV